MRVPLLSTRSGSNAKGGGARICGSAVPSATGCLLWLMAAATACMIHFSPAPAFAENTSQAPTAATAEQKPPEASAQDIDGETMFATSCGFCHENGGRAAGKGPKLAGTKRSDEFIINRVKNGKPGAMPAFGHAFSDGQIIAILAYIRGLEE